MTHPPTNWRLANNLVTPGVTPCLFANFLGLDFPFKSLILLVGAAGFEPTTPSPPDWCANRAAPRPDARKATPF
jgi:hypothetical protein